MTHPQFRSFQVGISLAFLTGLAACQLGPVQSEKEAKASFSRLPAFPGAEGAGQFALGGRGGRVYTVTNLNDRGAGSLREAIEASGPRTVVFAVSGTIQLQSELIIKNGRITIAGQTAPGDGITLRDHPFTVAADDVVVRFIRSRLGDVTKVDGDAMGVVAGKRIIARSCVWSE